MAGARIVGAANPLRRRVSEPPHASNGGGPVLLFFRRYEHDVYFPGDRYLKRVVGSVVRRVQHRPQVSGFFVWYQLLKQALENEGVEVRSNDFRYAKAHPTRPVGIIGYREMLEGWALPNPVVLGPGLYDHPTMAPRLMEDPRFRSFVLTCDWMLREFAAVYGGDKCELWNAGIDTDRWPDRSGHRKTTDILIYDKIRWNRGSLVPQVIGPLEQVLDDRALTHETIVYGEYDYSMFERALSRSRAMAFVCEHETQGMAYQEAMASNVPVFAWDPGVWMDPNAEALGVGPIETTSVPYFSPACGLTFRSSEDLPRQFDFFWSGLESFEPRRYVLERLSFQESARRYLDIYARAAG